MEPVLFEQHILNFLNHNKQSTLPRGIFPAELKIAKFVPIYKNGTNNDSLIIVKSWELCINISFDFDRNTKPSWP